jgi:hypothetical protein
VQSWYSLCEEWVKLPTYQHFLKCRGQKEPAPSPGRLVRGATEGRGGAGGGVGDSDQALRAAQFGCLARPAHWERSGVRTELVIRSLK